MLVKKNRIPVLHIITIGILPSFLKKIVYRLKGYKIDKHVSLKIGCVVIGKDVQIGQNSSIGFFSIVRANHIKIGRFVKIGAMSVVDTEKFLIDDDARINEQVYVGGMKTPESALIMGKRTVIMQASYINPTMPITIGDDAGIGGHCLLFTHGSWNSVLEGYPVKFAPITIGKKVWLPWRVFVMPGVTIGDGSVVGADSLLSKSFPANTLIAGSPAKIVKENFPLPLTQSDYQQQLQTIFTDFIHYLKHNQFKVEKTDLVNGFLLTVNNHKNTSSLLCVESFDNIDVKLANDSIVVLKNQSANNSNRSSMIISLSEKSRIGTSNIGEEFVNFLSRYGVRFNRID